MRTAFCLIVIAVILFLSVSTIRAFGKVAGDYYATRNAQISEAAR